MPSFYYAIYADWRDHHPLCDRELLAPHRCDPAWRINTGERMNGATSAVMSFCISFSIALAGHSVAGAAGPAPAASTPTRAQQWLQQGQTLLAQNKYAEAIQCLDKAITTSTDPAAASETRRLLADAYTAWLQSLQVSRYQIANRVISEQERQAQIQQEVDQAKQALADLAAQRKAAQNSHGKSKVVVDPIAQRDQNVHELKIVTGTGALNKQTKFIAALNKQTKFIAALKQQLAALEVQIADVQSRAPTPTTLKITLATYGPKDVTAAVQNLVHGDKATICASADTFGWSQDQFPHAALKISYELRGEKKDITVPQGWKVKLPGAQLVSPPVAIPDPPWYETYAVWLLGGVAALLLIASTFWKPKSEKPEP